LEPAWCPGLGPLELDQGTECVEIVLLVALLELSRFDPPASCCDVHDSAKKSARLIKGAKDIYYPGAPHSITATRQDQVNAELLEPWCRRAPKEPERCYPGSDRREW
jgi:hypothetical protein